MNEFRQKLKTQLGSNLLIATYSILLFLILLNIKPLFSEISKITSYVSPFIMGIGVAFVLNLPMKLIENKLLSKTKLKPGPKRSLAITLTFVFGFLLGFAVIRFVFPQIQDSIVTLSSSLQGYVNNFDQMMNKFIQEFEISPEVWNYLNEQLDKIVSTVTTLIANIVPYTINTIASIASGTINMFLSIVLSIYMLASKERIITGVKKVCYSVLNTNAADKLVKVGRLTNHTFSRFIGGQLTEAVILGCLTIIGMLILRFDYALLIGTIIGLTSVVPIFGAFIGAIPGVVILFIISPLKALGFIIFLLVLQQFEGNVIYPRVVGNSIGISGMWIMFAMLLGGGLYGILGILLGIPAFAVFYILVKEWAENRLSEKNIPKQKYETK